MIKINKEILVECARSLKFELDGKQLELLEEEFESIVAQMNYLAAIKGIDSLEPMTFPFLDHQTFMDEDVAVTPTASAIQLCNTDNKLGNQIKIPKVLG